METSTIEDQCLGRIKAARALFTGKLPQTGPTTTPNLLNFTITSAASLDKPDRAKITTTNFACLWQEAAAPPWQIFPGFPHRHSFAKGLDGMGAAEPVVLGAQMP